MAVFHAPGGSSYFELWIEIRLLITCSCYLISRLFVSWSCRQANGAVQLWWRQWTREVSKGLGQRNACHKHVVIVGLSCGPHSSVLPFHAPNQDILWLPPRPCADWISHCLNLCLFLCRKNQAPPSQCHEMRTWMTVLRPLEMSNQIEFTRRMQVGNWSFTCHIEVSIDVCMGVSMYRWYGV